MPADLLPDPADRPAPAGGPRPTDRGRSAARGSREGDGAAARGPRDGGAAGGGPPADGAAARGPLAAEGAGAGVVPPARRWRHVVLVGLLLEAVVLALVGGLAGWQVLSGRSGAPGTGTALAVVALLMALVLVLAGRSYHRGGRSRGFVVTWQLVQAGSAGTVIGSGPAPAVLVVAWAAVAVAVAVTVGAVADAAHEPRALPD